MVASLRLIARAPRTASRQYARALSTSAVRRQNNNWDDAVKEYNKNFDAGVKDASKEMAHDLDSVSLHADQYAKSIAERLKAVFGDQAPSAKDIKTELQRQASLARTALKDTDKEFQQDSKLRDKIDRRLKSDFDDFNSKVAQN